MSARVLLIALLVCVTATGRAAADDLTTIRLWNIGGQAGMTLASAAIQRKLHGWRDVVRCLTSGSVSGLGIYESKVLVGKNHPRTGWILANVAGSLSENASAGRHPLAQIGYTLGPVRFRVSMPHLDPASTSRIAVDASVYQTVAFVLAVNESGVPGFRDGLIAFQRDLRPDDDHLGATAGVFPAVFVDEQVVWLHEFTHAVQSFQIEVAEPPSPWRRMQFNRDPPGGKRLIVFEQVKIGMFNFANSAYVAARPYFERWPEVEAFRLTEGVNTWR